MCVCCLFSVVDGQWRCGSSARLHVPDILWKRQIHKNKRWVIQLHDRACGGKRAGWGPEGRLFDREVREPCLMRWHLTRDWNQGASRAVTWDVPSRTGAAGANAPRWERKGRNEMVGENWRDRQRPGHVELGSWGRELRFYCGWWDTIASFKQGGGVIRFVIFRDCFGCGVENSSRETRVEAEKSSELFGAV